MSNANSGNVRPGAAGNGVNATSLPPPPPPGSAQSPPTSLDETFPVIALVEGHGAEVDSGDYIVDLTGNSKDNSLQPYSFHPRSRARRHYRNTRDLEGYGRKSPKNRSLTTAEERRKKESKRLARNRSAIHTQKRRGGDGGKRKFTRRKRRKSKRKPRRLQKKIKKSTRKPKK